MRIMIVPLWNNVTVTSGVLRAGSVRQIQRRRIIAILLLNQGIGDYIISVWVVGLLFLLVAAVAPHCGCHRRRWRRRRRRHRHGHACSMVKTGQNFANGNESNEQWDVVCPSTKICEFNTLSVRRTGRHILLWVQRDVCPSTKSTCQWGFDLTASSCHYMPHGWFCRLPEIASYLLHCLAIAMAVVDGGHTMHIIMDIHHHNPQPFLCVVWGVVVVTTTYLLL